MDKIEKIYQHFKLHYLVSTDSRKIEKDTVFFALKGENFDGNDFALQVANEGIAACVVADRKDLPDHERIIKVDDSLKALQQLALLHRTTLNTTVLSITGTNGKTTTKELVSSVLKKKYRIINTQGNFNNHIGVPLTLLQIKPDTEIAVVEMGANHPKEIETLANIACPNYGIITNIGKAHLEGFGSFEGVIKTKNELYCYLRAHNGMAFVNKDNDLLMKLAADLQQYTYGQQNADLNVAKKASDPFLSIEWQGQSIATKLIGDYNFENVAAAIAVGTYFKVPASAIIEALESYTPSNSRSQVIESGKNRIIMDAYNANPVSMQAAIKNFGNICSKKSMLILGDMRELGKDSEHEHQAILQLIEKHTYNKVYLVGPCFHALCKGTTWTAFENADQLGNFLKEHPVEGFDILVKGSRGIQLEKIVPLL